MASRSFGLGTFTLARLAVRRDRVRTPVWLVGIVVMYVTTAQSYEGLYPTHAERVALANTLGTNAAVTALTGPAYDLLNVGGFTAWRLTSFAVVLVAIMSITCVVRHSRADEEAGRSELVRAAAVGRGSELSAALLVAGGTDVVLAALLVLSLCALGLPLAGSLVLGAGIGGAGLVFGAVGAVTAQLATTARGATGMALGTVGAAFVVRMVGDRSASALSWLSPIGWAERTRAFAGDRWEPLVPMAVTAIVLAGVSFLLAADRDLGAGVFQPRARRTQAGPLLTRVEGLAFRLHRGMLAWWAAGVAAYAVVVGFLTRDVRGLLDANAQVAASFRRIAHGAALERGYVVAMAGVLGLLAGGFALQAVLRLRRDESALFAELTLSRAVHRSRWFTSYLLVSAVGTLIITLSAGAGAGLADAARRRSLDPVGTWVTACILQAPAVWVLVGLAAALVGVIPRAASIAWFAYGATALLGQLGQLLDLPSWIRALSPFDHVPAYPATGIGFEPLLVLVLTGTVLTAVGYLGLSRRDIIG